MAEIDFFWIKFLGGHIVESVKPRYSKQKSFALTRVEVLLVVFLLAGIMVWLMTFVDRSRPKAYGFSCMNNLKQVSLAYRIWAGDNNGKYPMELSVTNGGTMEFAATGDVVKTFQIMSNYLSTPKVLFCPADSQRTNAAHFESLTTSNISYFIGIDATSSRPQSVLVGDDNFAVNGVPVKSGLLQLSTNTPVTWTSSRHVSFNVHFWTPESKRHAGNILLTGDSDDRIRSFLKADDNALFQALTGSGLATNRLAIP